MKNLITTLSILLALLLLQTTYIPIFAAEKMRQYEIISRTYITEYSDDEQNGTVWCVCTDQGLQLPMSKVGMLVAADDDVNFSILDLEGNVLAENVKRISFLEKNATGIELPISIKEDKTFKCYVDGHLTIVGGKGSFCIYSILGHMVSKGTIQGDETLINVSNLPSGSYILVNKGLSFKFNKK